jgi:SLA1 homology domain 1, SHD1
LAEVRILEAGKSWVVSGKYQSPVDNRRDYTSIIIRKDGQFAAGNLLLDDNVVMDKILSNGSVAVAEQPAKSVTPEPTMPEPTMPEPTIPEPAKVPESTTRTWTSADGKFTVEAEFGGAIGSKVTLRKADGSVITLDADKLSDADREWIGKRK